MISRLRGIIVEKQPPVVLIEINGVGYDVYMPMTCFYELPDPNNEIIIFTQVFVREDMQILYGFIKKRERALFRDLIKVNGIGPKLALEILSRMSTQQFISAIENEEISKLLKLPGIGKRTAQRLIVEMKDRFKNLCNPYTKNNKNIFSIVNKNTDLENNDTKSEAISALIVLGYKPHEAISMIRKVSNLNTDCQTIIREALRTIL